MQSNPPGRPPGREAAQKKQAGQTTSIVLTVLATIGYVKFCLALFFTVPKFNTMLESFGGALPWGTKVVIATSDFLISVWWIALPVLVALPAWGLYHLIKKNHTMRFRILLPGISLAGIVVLFSLLFAGLYQPIFRLVNIISE